MPHVQMHPKEIALMQAIVDTGANLSHAYIAEILNNAFPRINHGTRSREGVYKTIKAIKQELKKQHKKVKS